MSPSPAEDNRPAHASDPQHYDVLVVGAGLHGALATLALLESRPQLRLVLVERDARPAGNHTWCFHAADVPDGVGSWFEFLPLIRWPGYRVAFPGFARELALPYCCLTADGLRQALDEGFARHPAATLLGACPVRQVHADRVELTDGRVLRAGLVIDARGGQPPGQRGGYQKFLGLEVELDRDCGLDRPVLMDACVEQGAQFRFMYVLPLAPRRLLIEDTAFARLPDLDAAARRAAIADYAARRGWRVVRVLREESGVLPMPWQGRLPRPGRPLVLGYRGGWFHPATGYSMPWALRLADLLTRCGADPLPAVRGAWRSQLRQYRFGLVLNALAFRAFRGDLMWHPFARFHRLPPASIARFHGQRSTALDMARVLVGRPPRGFGSAWFGRFGRERTCS